MFVNPYSLLPSSASSSSPHFIFLTNLLEASDIRSRREDLRIGSLQDPWQKKEKKKENNKTKRKRKSQESNREEKAKREEKREKIKINRKKH
jgi:hypothetical protein